MTEAFVSTTSRLMMGIQADKDTPKATLLSCGRFKDSALFPVFDEANPGAEHYCTALDRPTLQKSRTIRTGYMGAFSGTWFLYPEFIGMALIGAGFAEVPSGLTPAFTHTFTIADRDDAKYMTVISRVGDSDGGFERRGTGARVAQLQMIANTKGILTSMQGVAIDVDDSAGTETYTEEPDKQIAATDGTLSAQISSVDLVTTIRTSLLQITNPLYVQDVNLFSAKRANLPQLGIAAQGMLGGIDVTETLWEKLIRNGATSGSPSLVIPSMALTYKFESPENIPTGVVPYSFQVTVPNAEVRMTPYSSSGRNLIRCSLEWMMYDNGTEPISIALVNGKATYA